MRWAWPLVAASWLLFLVRWASGLARSPREGQPRHMANDWR